MSKMKFDISAKIFERFPGASIGVIIANDIDNSGDEKEIDTLLTSVEKDTCKSFENRLISDDPTIRAWRQAYRSFGAREYCASVEALLKRMVKKKGLWHINKLVDLYNFISIKYILPVGGEDLDTIKGDLTLAEAKGDEEFIALGSTENDPPLPDEPIYRDQEGVICRRWNWRESDRTKLMPETKNAILVIEGILPEERSRIESALREFAALISKYCGGTNRTLILDKNNPSAEISH